MGLVAVPLVAIIVYVIQDEPPERTKPRGVKAPVLSSQPSGPKPPPPLAPNPVVPPMPEPKEVATAQQVEPEPTVEIKPEHQAKIDEAKRIATTDPEKSRALLKDVLFYDPDNEQALEELGLKLLHDEKHAEARDLAKRCLEARAENENCWAIAHYALEQRAEVPYMVKATEACLSETPDNVGCLNGMVNYHLMEGRYGKADEFVDTMIESNPDSPLTLLAEGRIKGANGDYGEALTLFEAACEGGEQQACYRAEALRKEGWKPLVPEE